MKIVLGYPSLDDPCGYVQVGQNRQSKIFSIGEEAAIFPCVMAWATTLLKRADHDVAWVDAQTMRLSQEQWRKDLVAFHGRGGIVWVFVGTLLVSYMLFEVVPRGFPPQRLGWTSLCADAPYTTPAHLGGKHLQAMKDLGLMSPQGDSMPDPWRLTDLCRAKERLWVEWRSGDLP